MHVYVHTIICTHIHTKHTHYTHALAHVHTQTHILSLHPGDAGLQVQLWLEGKSDEPRYTFTIIDLHKSRARNGPFAVFIVPQGRLVIKIL